MRFLEILRKSLVTQPYWAETFYIQLAILCAFQKGQSLNFNIHSSHGAIELKHPLRLPTNPGSLLISFMRRDIQAHSTTFRFQAHKPMGICSAMPSQSRNQGLSLLLVAVDNRSQQM